MKKVHLFLFLFMFSVVVAFPVQNWKAKFDTEFNNTKDAYWLGLSTSLNSNNYYYLGYGIDATTAMYKATGNVYYLDKALGYIQNVITRAKVSNATNFPDSDYKDGYKGWVCLTQGSVLNEEVALYESMMWRYVTRLLFVIKNTSTLYNNPTYRSQFDTILAFTETHIWDKWYNRGSNQEWIYRSRTHMRSHWGFIALDLYKVSSNATRKAQYQTVYTNINNALRSNMINVNVNSYFWNQTWDSTGVAPIIQDTSHGNNVIAYIVESYERGNYWTREDMVKYINTLKTIIYNGVNHDFADFVNGTYGAFEGKLDTGRFQADGWVKLGKYHREIQDIYEYVIINNPTAVTSASQFAQLYANMALNEKEFNELFIAPAKPVTPFPANNATGVSRNVSLTWGWSANTIAPYYGVYFGTAPNPPYKGTIDQLPGSGREYIPGLLLPNTRYYWRIVCLGANNMVTLGDVWTFVTGAN